MIKNATFLGYYVYMNLNIWGDFQICISVPLRGLKSHQRSCRVIKGLSEEMVSSNDTETDEIIDNIDDFIPENLPELKPVIKLPKTETGWKEADTYFRSVLHAGDINISDLNTSSN